MAAFRAAAARQVASAELLSWQPMPRSDIEAAASIRPGHDVIDSRPQNLDEKPHPPYRTASPREELDEF
jgi:hypothetical protein